jgi:hypothetical protein
VDFGEIFPPPLLTEINFIERILCGRVVKKSCMEGLRSDRAGSMQSTAVPGQIASQGFFLLQGRRNALLRSRLGDGIIMVIILQNKFSDEVWRRLLRV